MSREEAEQLTMTEFQMMLKAKFPDEKGFPHEEYDAVIDADVQRTNDLKYHKRIPCHSLAKDFLGALIPHYNMCETED
ncbi:hypothetical protein Xedl_01398 [Xenorhabdus eapokensis]|uniref:Uncharacterized protein n=1 Tax=Xenorhabdus eapokensis TaxID=1873482 RepID=A0A1Q5TUK9_9GAMM|nr:hypothetical protein Xedl_01398 [Xenorhabdus eapokensis]